MCWTCSNSSNGRVTSIAIPGRQLRIRGRRLGSVLSRPVAQRGRAFTCGQRRRARSNPSLSEVLRAPGPGSSTRASWSTLSGSKASHRRPTPSSRRSAAPPGSDPGSSDGRGRCLPAARDTNGPRARGVARHGMGAARPNEATSCSLSAGEVVAFGSRSRCRVRRSPVGTHLRGPPEPSAARARPLGLLRRPLPKLHAAAEEAKLALDRSR